MRSARPVEPQEPIHVRVRIRQYGAAVPGLGVIRPGKPDLGRMPIGSVLDCYL